MLCSSQNGIIQRAKPMLACLAVSFSTVWLCPLCHGDPVVPTVPQLTEWISGPANADLGQIASIAIPQGYKLTGESGARAMLERMTNPVPKGLVGVLSPEAGGWWIVLKYADIGYVKDDDFTKMDPASILKGIGGQIERQNADSSKQGLSPIGSVDWELKPLYEANDHALEWALRAQTQPQPMVSQGVRLLGRHGVLEAIVVRPYKGFSDLVPLKELARGISFKTGERYADYQKGDKLSTSTLAALITAEDVARPAVVPVAGIAAQNAIPVKSPWFWAVLAVLTLAVVLSVVWMVKKFGRRDSVTDSKTGPAQAIVVSPVTGNGARPDSLPFSPATLAAKPGSVHKRNGKRHGGHRKKVFDYNRYFTDLNSAVSSHINQVEPVAPSDFSTETDRSLTPVPSYPVSEPSQPVPPDVNSEVIAHQKSIIDEQHRLIQEQTKLIEEKSKLIAEKNQLLKMQSEFIENKLL